MLALRAEAAGVQINRLVLWEPPFMTDPEAPRRAREYTSKLAELLTAGQRGDAMALFMYSIGLPEAMIAGMRSSPDWRGMEAIAPMLPTTRR